MHKHYIRIDENDFIIKRFSDAFEQPEDGDICVNEDGGRHYNDPVTNNEGQYYFKWVDGGEVARTEQELNDERTKYLIDNPIPKTDSEKIADLESETVMNMLAMAELHMMIIALGGGE